MVETNFSGPLMVGVVMTLGAGPLILPTRRAPIWVDLNASGAGNGKSPKNAYTTIQAAVTAGEALSHAGTELIQYAILPGDYEEAVTITKSFQRLVNIGEAGNVAIAPGGNGIAVTIEGTRSE